MVPPEPTIHCRLSGLVSSRLSLSAPIRPTAERRPDRGGRAGICFPALPPKPRLKRSRRSLAIITDMVITSACLLRAPEQSTFHEDDAPSEWWRNDLRRP